jgi:predicted nucleotidyltransferase
MDDTLSDMPLDSTKLTERIRAELPNVMAVYLFGSTAAGAAGPESDIDIAVLDANPILSLECWDLAQELATEAGRDVDIVDLRVASTVMRAQVIATGRRLFCADEIKCGEFEDYAYSAYARLNEERRAILEDIRLRGSVYGR